MIYSHKPSHDNSKYQQGDVTFLFDLRMENK